MLDTSSTVIMGVAGSEAQTAGKDLLASDDVGGPVESMAAVVNRAATLGGLVHGAQELPFAGAHLRAGGGGAGRAVEEKAYDQVVALVREEAAELIEPKGAVDAFGLRGHQRRRLAGYWSGVFPVLEFGIAVVEGFEVFLELERGIELEEGQQIASNCPMSIDSPRRGE